MNPPKGGQARFYMSAYLLDAICAHNAFPSMNWAWSPRELVVHIYYKLLSDCSHRGVMEKLTDHFLIPLYKVIFEEGPLCMSPTAMEAILEIADWFASLDGTFLRMFGREKLSHVLPRYVTDKLIIKNCRIISPQGYQLLCIGRRKHLGQLFLCKLDCTR